MYDADRQQRRAKLQAELVAQMCDKLLQKAMASVVRFEKNLQTFARKLAKRHGRLRVDLIQPHFNYFFSNWSRSGGEVLFTDQSISDSQDEAQHILAVFGGEKTWELISAHPVVEGRRDTSVDLRPRLQPYVDEVNHKSPPAGERPVAATTSDNAGV